MITKFENIKYRHKKYKNLTSKYDINSDEYIYNLKYSFQGNVLIEEDINFLFSYYNKYHSNVFFTYIEPDGKQYDIKKSDLSKPFVDNLLAEVLTKYYDKNGTLIKKFFSYRYFRRYDIDGFLDDTTYKKEIDGIKVNVRKLTIIPKSESDFEFEKTTLKYKL